MSEAQQHAGDYWATYGRLVSGATEEVGGWRRCHVDLPARDGKHAAYGRCIALVENLEDAKLIEAAPKLLEKLRLLTKFAEDAPGLDFNEDQTRSWIAVVTADARALISKIEG